MNNYDKYKFLREELKPPRFIDENEEIQWFTTQLYGLYKQSYRLRQENKQLQQRIDEAIEYIKNNSCGDLAITFGKDLLEILKGNNNCHKLI